MNINRNITNTPKIYKVKSVCRGDSVKYVRVLNKDTFERTEKSNSMNNDNDNLQFKKIKIAFYPEDVKKMRGMSVEERIKFKQELKASNRYIKLGSDEENKAE